MGQTEAPQNETRTVSLSSSKLLGDGIYNAISGLSKMVSREVSLHKFELRNIPIKDVPDLFGGPEALVVGVYLEVQRYSEVYMLVVYEPKTAFDLIDLMLDQAPGSTANLSEMERSVLGEVGNVMASLFLSHLADTTGRIFGLSPPAVMMDMAGAILDVALAHVAEYSDDIYVAQTSFGTDDQVISGTFLVLPVLSLSAKQ